MQSKVGTIFKDVRDALLKGRKVLFVGTPCQVNGLLSYINASMNQAYTEHLLTADFVCHGVPSRFVWRKYLNEVCEGRKPVSINFRDKTNGWRNFSLKIRFDDDSQYLCSWHKDPYVQGFIKNLYLRECCYQCKFRGIDRNSDFTLADFWGVHTALPEMFDDRGTSIIMAHNTKAINMIEHLKAELIVREIENEIIIQTNSPVVQSVPFNPKRNSFIKTMSVNDRITNNIIKYTEDSVIDRIFRRISRLRK